MSLDLATLPLQLGNNRSKRTQQCDLIVVHTNEGPEGVNSAEGLASFLKHAPDNYNVIVDEDGAIRTAMDDECVWGAGGVNSRAWHICITGRAAFTPETWADDSESKAVGIVAELVRQACIKFGIPLKRTLDTRAPNRGVCGHVDVSRYFKASMGHTDPGPAFPWDRIFATSTSTPTPAPEEEHMVKTFARSDNGQPQEYFYDGTVALPVDEAEKLIYIGFGIVKELTSQVVPQHMLAAAYQRGVNLARA